MQTEVSAVSAPRQTVAQDETAPVTVAIPVAA
jgi:hypothetical protein